MPLRGVNEGLIPHLAESMGDGAWPLIFMTFREDLPSQDLSNRKRRTCRTKHGISFHMHAICSKFSGVLYNLNPGAGRNGLKVLVIFWRVVFRASRI